MNFSAIVQSACWAAASGQAGAARSRYQELPLFNPVAASSAARMATSSLSARLMSC